MKTFSPQFFVLTSPPASGKTFWIKCLKNVLPESEILVISPLRALADECKASWENMIQIMTPEEWLVKKPKAQIVILDEFHLFFYWGDTFRPLMWEVFFELSLTTEIIFALTATLSEEMRNEIKKFDTHFEEIYWLNFGNQILKTPPGKYIKASSRQWIMKHIEHQKKNSSVKLIFCQYRNEVFDLEKKLTKMGFNCISCVGGESKYMQAKLKINPAPDYIISTTVLSHGVNLPSIRTIYFTYKLSNIDFWIQMVARGGRRGENYHVFALEKPEVLDWNYLRNLLLILIENIKLKWRAPEFLFPKT